MKSNTITKQMIQTLRTSLLKAQQAYMKADGSLDISPMAAVLAKEELNIARSDYNYICTMHVQELYFSEEDVL